MIDGLLLVDKPAGWTSHDVVGRTRRLAATRRVGHAGTLDPMATGVLVLGINRATKLLTYLVGCDKAYDATIRLGQGTLTDDAEGEVTSSPGASGLTDERIADAVAALTGDLLQVPSAVSAIKIDGKRSYARVRGGEDVDLPARPITVSHFEIRDLRRHDDLIDLDVSVEVSSGTYVRALARDLGAALGSAGHLTALRRTRVGAYDLGACHRLDDLGATVERGDPLPVIPLAEAARAQFPTRELTADEAQDLRHGKRIGATGLGAVAAAVGPGDDLVAMIDDSGRQARSLVVFPPA
ncbi:tRNA pseudouridine(55) synthase TruB [Calidifontibacter sp. DB0510]|uniref:tRNA pseudouridine synthase B n=1 Tax=Metallococcus carri TaxID=1656884 RepID=A0A967AYW3_9MICO|nr:tRNA pseudouridine(55) synthase TruB [Metallococcus carri]NHN54268.1 tRNA pseudouridine(55) synthase TruB [Metallococcus carri]NOP36892.1 tRNA pseudouridine(55) synthase TruB [Calidifontibacter sp. DB2511S]